MSQKNFLPAEFYDDMLNEHCSSKASSRKYDRKVKNVANTNKITWEDQNFDWMLNREELIALEGIKRTFANNQGRELLHDEINRAFDGRNPHEITLKFCYNLKESLDKKSLTRTLLEMLLWIKDPVISDELQIYAFNHFSQTTRTGVNIASKAYRLKEIKNTVIEKLKRIAKHPWTTQAAIIAIEFELCDELPIDLVLIPLWLENNFDIYFEYMDVSKSSRMKMIDFLDSLMKSNDTYSSYLLKNNITNVMARTPKIIKNHILKVCDRYQLEESQTPHTTHYRNMKFLKHFMYEYYDCEKVTKEIYEDKVVEIADKSVELQFLLVQLSCDRGYGKDAAKWKNHYKLNINIDRYEQIDLSAVTKTFQDDEAFYKLSIDASNIILIDTQESFDEMFDIIKSHKTFGLDCEQRLTHELSILQIAVKDKIFIIDAMTMQDKFNWKKLINEFFNNCEITKLGCGIFTDLKTIGKFLTTDIDDNASYVDLGRLSEKLMAIPNFKFPFEDEIRCETRPGLAKLTKLFLGRPLNKSLAVSNWAKRPLREEQIIYAALDAYCAIEIFDKINEILIQLNLSLKDIYLKDDVKDKKKLK